MAVLDSILDFLNSAKILSQEENIYYCKNRDAANSRNQKWINLFLQNKLDINNAAILTAIIGEITNNSFDHNLGMWNGPSGCMVGFQITSQDIVVYIADRGQGIIETLSKALPQPNKPSEILRKAFEERVTGRAPEKRGNGLKFVNLHIQKNQNSLVCYTQNEIYFINEEFIKILPSNLPKEFGTLICIKWRINESQNQ